MNRPMNQLEHMMAVTDAVLNPDVKITGAGIIETSAKAIVNSVEFKSINEDDLPPMPDAEIQGRSEDNEEARDIKYWQGVDEDTHEEDEE